MIQRTIEAAELVKPVQDFRMFRLLNVLIDAWADHNWALWETALLADERQQRNSQEREGWNDTPVKKTLGRWGVVDQHGIYAIAGLTKRQSQVAELYFDRCMEPREIGQMLRCDAVTVRRHLQNIRERLARLAA